MPLAEVQKLSASLPLPTFVTARCDDNNDGDGDGDGKSISMCTNACVHSNGWVDEDEYDMMTMVIKRAMFIQHDA
jgi:hypothetical protein